MNRAQRRAELRHHGKRRAVALGSAAVLASAGGGAALVLASSAPAGANAPIVVDSLTDDGTGTTLRDAIDQANSVGGQDTITFSVTGTITLTSDLPNIDEGTLIQGPGADQLTVDGDDSFQIFNFFGISTAEYDSSVSGLTLTGGHTGVAGGAIVKAYSNGNLAISDCVITGNSTDGPGGGIALYDTRGDITITDTVVSDNESGSGGGGLAASDNDPGHEMHVTVTGSSFTGNHADTIGGGIWAQHGVIDVSDTTVSVNDAASFGGGLALYDVEATFTGVTIDGNESGTSVGGGLQASSATVSIVDSSISDNVASRGGGGLYLGGSTLTVSGSTIAGNEAGFYGGGLYVDAFAIATTIVNSTISSNTARNAGGVNGGVGVGLVITQSTVTGNIATAPSAGSAVGGIKIGAVVVAVDGPPAGTLVATGAIVAGNGGLDVGSVTGTLATVDSTASVIGLVDDVGVTVVDGGRTQRGVTAEALHLGPLADNGGPTLTHALLPGSVAIDAGPVPPATFTGDTWDQRGEGFPRVVAGRVDAGAFEVQPAVEPEPTFTG